MENISYVEALNLILDNTSTVGIDSVSLLDCSGQVAAEDVIAPLNLPSFDNSAMDGFAIQIADAQASKAYTITGSTYAGDVASGRLNAEIGVRIMTGAAVPPGCNAVIPFEDADEIGNTIRLKDGMLVQPGQHIRHAGEDVRQGDIVLAEGTVLGPAEICMLASLGKTSVHVYRKPRVAIVATGDELIEPGESLSTGKIFNGNSLALAAAVTEAGATPVILGIAKDDRINIKKILLEGLDADVLVTTAGVSVGDRDLVRSALEDLGVKEMFWKVQIKPGKAFAFGIMKKKPAFSLPGNPVSALVVF